MHLGAGSSPRQGQESIPHPQHLACPDRYPGQAVRRQQHHLISDEERTSCQAPPQISHSMASALLFSAPATSETLSSLNMQCLFFFVFLVAGHDMQNFLMQQQRPRPKIKKKKNPLSNAGDEGSIPDGGTKIPCASGQLSSHEATTEAMSCSKDPVWPS